MDLIKCFHCDEPGHWVSECPLLQPPADKAEHDARFTRVMDRFFNEGLDPHVKQRIITKENELWKQVQAKAA